MIAACRRRRKHQKVNVIKIDDDYGEEINY
jgi:hypothetical protein